MAPSTNTADQAIKRRACDECRRRKLSCSKEPKGCSRCVRENIQCYYSEQKPMGRPRKRQRNIEEKEFVVDPYLPEPGGLTYFDDNMLIDPYFEHNTPIVIQGEEFMAADGRINGSQSYVTSSETGLAWLSASESLDGNINLASQYENANPMHLAVQDPPPRDLDITEHQHHHPPNKAPCGCLAAMYLAMSSIQELPTDITSALVTVRVAANTTRNVLRCEKCGILKVIDLHPPIEVFQNTMMLGTIIPTVVNGYKRLAKMVDCETKLSTAAGAKKLFKLDEYGCMEEMRGEFQHLQNVLLDPPQWRSAVCRLLQADVYGYDDENTGLKGIIAEMEERQRTRHRELDRLKATGMLKVVEERMCLSERDAVCLRILDAAKVALDSLVIE